MQAIRAKFKCQSTTGYEGEEPSVSVHLTAVTNDSEDPTGENKVFSKWTPTASLDMHITNPAAISFFVEGALYYLDFTPADK